MSLTKASYSLINGATLNGLDSGMVGDCNGTTGTNNNAEFTAAIAAAASSKNTLLIPAGNYYLTAGFEIPAGVSIVFDPKAYLYFDTAVATYLLKINEGCTILGNNARIFILNSAWNGNAIYLNGASNFRDDRPTMIDGLHIIADPTFTTANHGTGIGFDATNAGEIISWVRVSNITVYALNYGVTLNAGSSGSAGNSATWHWINANTFTNVNLFNCNNGLNIRGLNGVPAECSGNFFTNIEIQVYTAPVYIEGASANQISCYVWDFYGNPLSIKFSGTGTSEPIYNIITSNVNMGDVTDVRLNTLVSGGGDGGMVTTGKVTALLPINTYTTFVTTAVNTAITGMTLPAINAVYLVTVKVTGSTDGTFFGSAIVSTGTGTTGITVLANNSALLSMSGFNVQLYTGYVRDWILTAIRLS